MKKRKERTWRKVFLFSNPWYPPECCVEEVPTMGFSTDCDCGRSPFAVVDSKAARVAW